MNYPEYIGYVESEIERIAALHRSPFTTGRVRRDLLFLSKVAKSLGMGERADTLKSKSQEYEQRCKKEHEDLHRQHSNYDSWYCRGGEVFYDTDYLIDNACNAVDRYEKETKELLAPLEKMVEVLEDVKKIREI